MQLKLLFPVFFSSHTICHCFYFYYILVLLWILAWPIAREYFHSQHIFDAIRHSLIIDGTVISYLVLCAGIWIILMVRLICLSANKNESYSLTAIAPGISLIDAAQPFEPCCGCTKSINQTLEDFVRWPLACGEAIYRCSSNCPSPN